MYPKDYRYTKEHEWIKADGATGTIGITDYAQHELGDVVFVELPKVGTQLKAGQSLGTIESVKAVSEIFTPVSGEVTETNPALADAPEKINSDPHGSAWLIKIRLADPKEPASLMDAAAYEAYVTEKAKELLRLIRFLPKSPSERQEMLAAIGVQTVGELFKSIPEKFRLRSPLPLPGPLSEAEIVQYFQARAGENGR